MKRSRLSGVSERSFAGYLDQREIAWRYGEQVGGRTVGFSVFAGARSFVAGVIDPSQRRATRPGFASAHSTLRDELAESGPTRRSITAVRRAGLPYVAVVGRTGSDGAIDPDELALALFGGPAGQWGSGGTADSGSHRVRGVSAVAVMEFFNPTLWEVERAWGQRIDRAAPAAATRRAALEPDGIDRLLVMGDVAQRLVESGAFLPDARSVRLAVAQNPFASHPLDVASLGGPHDEQWRLVECEGVPTYRRSWTGPRLHEVGGAARRLELVEEQRRPA
jgi:hypothetical protein